jgi:hypothetical protein
MSRQMSKHRGPPALSAGPAGPDLTRLSGIAAEAARTYRAVACGTLGERQARTQLALLEQMARLARAAELEARIATLEKILCERKAPQ